jgi:hypothetical protein
MCRESTLVSISVGKNNSNSSPALILSRISSYESSTPGGWKAILAKRRPFLPRRIRVAREYPYPS